MKLKETLEKLEKLGNEKMCKQNRKNGAHDNQFGVRLGEIRKFAKTIKTNHELALELWDTGNIDARLLAILLMKVPRLSSIELDKLVKSVEFFQVADWINAYIVKKHPDNEKLRLEWMTSSDPMAQRAGWNLTSVRVVKNPEGIDIKGLLDRIESEMGDAHPFAQWTMNFTLGEIGIKFPKHRKRALEIGEKLGVYRDYPTSKGCTSPFAPIWISEMVSRQNVIKSDK
jgi:3-methyladenine DNA glycosylase AlkD